MDRKQFNTLFPNDEAVIHYIVDKCFNGIIKCPFCGETYRISREKGRIKFFHCNSCNKSFSIFTNTIFHKTHMKLTDWMFAINLFLQAKKGTSSCQLQRELGVTHKTAWRINHQIRKAMADKEFSNKFECIVEIDETYVGGKPRKGASQMPNKRGRGTKKTPVVGIKERSSKRVYAQVAFPNKEGKVLSGKQLFKILDKVCKDDTLVMTDDFRGYNFLDHKNKRDFFRIAINHSMGEFSRGCGIHTNGIESFWAVLKRGIYGVYHHISVKYMQKYIDEFCFRSNNHKEDAFFVLIKKSMNI